MINGHSERWAVEPSLNLREVFPSSEWDQPVGGEKRCSGEPAYGPSGVRVTGATRTPSERSGCCSGVSCARRIVRSECISTLIYDEFAIDLYRLTCALYSMVQMQKRRRSA